MPEQTRNITYAKSFREQFTLRGMIIGGIGSVILTMSSMYVALRLGALPWPIIFVALVSMTFLKVLGKSNINEINVTHTAMSAGAMTAGGLAFTLPAIFMLNPEADVNLLKIFIVVIGGVLLGLIFTALIRKYFVETKELPYPMGQAAAETLIVGDEGGKDSATLFISLGAAGVFTFFRDAFTLITGRKSIPAAIGTTIGPVWAGVWLSPMLVSVGYIIGPVFIGVWFLGALIGDFGVQWAAVSMGFWSAETAGAIKASLGIGLMVGTGIGIIVKGILPKIKEIFGPMFSKSALSNSLIDLRWSPIVMVVLAALFTTVCQMGIVPSIITILGVWLATSMSAQCVGQSGINPMEVFGIIILLAAKVVSPAIGHEASIYVAAVVAIACGLAGDVMNDFKAGYVLKSDPKAQWIGEAIGGLIGAFVAVGSFYALLAAYGPGAFGNPDMFIAPQAGMVAAMVGGIPHVGSFWIGLVIGCVLYIVNFPVMTLGLGVYLPFYLSLTAFIGGAIRFIVQKAAPDWDKKGTGTIIASGLLGGEAVVGVIIAIVQAAQGIVAM